MTGEEVDVQEIMRLLPHRYPFLLIDRVLDYEPGKEIVALKNVTINEPFFGGHFPNYPVMPGVLIVEALAQASALLAFKTIDLTVSRSVGQDIDTGQGSRSRRRHILVRPARHCTCIVRLTSLYWITGKRPIHCWRTGFLVVDIKGQRI